MVVLTSLSSPSKPIHSTIHRRSNISRKPPKDKHSRQIIRALFPEPLLIGSLATPKTLRAGRIETTYGTDFDCITEHILAHHFDKAVILTDGFANMNEDNREQLRTRSFRALTVLFGGKRDCDEFAPFGDVLKLEDVTN